MFMRHRLQNDSVKLSVVKSIDVFYGCSVFGLAHTVQNGYVPLSRLSDILTTHNLQLYFIDMFVQSCTFYHSDNRVTVHDIPMLVIYLYVFLIFSHNYYSCMRRGRVVMLSVHYVCLCVSL